MLFLRFTKVLTATTYAQRKVKLVPIAIPLRISKVGGIVKAKRCVVCAKITVAREGICLLIPHI